ncbi:RT0821/Lpp0805 family surface protein [Telmatospirillum sp. J64-1]|uniref:RT0821/Lpp0805 family surface protein n=1 Tax=Telmatospirillum sp. J64-1 TaxID=2502183 RepID=UPI00115CAC68|nr:RT0821/Lpp0805 family surface protein [Telmatospirillum sp. J64-1]
MKNIKKSVAALLSAAMLASCAQGGAGGTGMSGETVGTLGGAAAGALAGAQFGRGSGQLAATAAGTLLGAYLGRQVGARLSEPAQNQAAQAERQALASNSSITWNNPESNASGTVTPVRSYQDGNRNCRDYVHTIYIEGRAQEARGTACQQPDGSWQLAN